MVKYLLKETQVVNGRPDENAWRVVRGLDARYVEKWPQSAQSLTGYSDDGKTYREIFYDNFAN